MSFELSLNCCHWLWVLSNIWLCFDTLKAIVDHNVCWLHSLKPYQSVESWYGEALIWKNQQKLDKQCPHGEGASDFIIHCLNVNCNCAYSNAYRLVYMWGGFRFCFLGYCRLNAIWSYVIENKGTCDKVTNWRKWLNCTGNQLHFSPLTHIPLSTFLSTV